MPQSRPSPLRSVFILATVGCALVLATGCGSKKDGESKPAIKTKTAKKPNKAPTSKKPFPQLSPDKISQVVVSWGKHTIAIDRGTPHWRVTTPYKGKVDPLMVAAVLRELERMEIGHQPVTTTPDAWPKYKLGTDDVVSIYVTHAGKKLPAIHIGDKKYARFGDNPGVYTRFHMNRYTWSRPPSEWRDRKVLQFDANAATALSVIDAKGATVKATRTPAPPAASKKVARAPDTWTLAEGKKVVGKLNPTIPSIIFSKLTVLRGVDIAKVDAATAGLVKPKLTLVVHVGDTQHALLLGKTVKDRVYVKVRGSERIWLVRTVDLKLVDRDPAGWGKRL